MARWVAAVVAILGVTLTGCSNSDKTVGVDEIEQLEDLRDVRVTLAPEVFNVGEGARVGVASDRRERVPFAVVIAEVGTAPRRITIGGTTYRLYSGCAEAGFYLTRERFSEVAFAVESALHDKLAPDAYCEG
jgi:hypothetical protein